MTVTIASPEDTPAAYRILEVDTGCSNFTSSRISRRTNDQLAMFREARYIPTIAEGC